MATGPADLQRVTRLPALRATAWGALLATLLGPFSQFSHRLCAQAPRDRELVITVATVAELVAALGPARTVRLQAGDYDLSTARLPSAFVLLEGLGTSGRRGRIVVHDVAELTIEGPEAGEARLFASSDVAFEFQRARSLRMKRLSCGGVPLQDVAVFGRSRAVDLRFREVNDLRLESVHALADGCGVWLFDQADDVELTGLTSDGGLTIETRGGRALRISRTRVRLPGEEPWLSLNGTADVVLDQIEILTPAAPGAKLESVLYVVQGSPAPRLSGVALIDAISGARRAFVPAQGSAAGAQATPVAPATPASLSVVLQRSPPKWTPSPDDEGRYTSVRLVLLDGRTIADQVALATAYRSGLDVDSIRARRLGSREGPILVTWTDIAQGNGNYQAESYVVLSAGPEATPLLSGGLAVSGHAGFADFMRTTLSITLEGDVLTRRAVTEGSYSRKEAAPGCLPMADEEKFFICEAAGAVESRYRFDGATLVAIGFEDYLRLEPGVDPAPLFQQGWQPAVAGRAAPRAGDWLRKALPLPEGAAKYPARGPLEVEH